MPEWQFMYVCALIQMILVAPSQEKVDLLNARTPNFLVPTISVHLKPEHEEKCLEFTVGYRVTWKGF